MTHRNQASEEENEKKSMQMASISAVTSGAKTELTKKMRKKVEANKKSLFGGLGKLLGGAAC